MRWQSTLACWQRSSLPVKPLEHGSRAALRTLARGGREEPAQVGKTLGANSQGHSFIQSTILYDGLPSKAVD